MAPFAILLLAVLPAASPPLPPDTASTGRLRHRLSLVLEAGATVTGLGSGLADQLRDAGYDDTTPAGCVFVFCSGPIAHPTEESPSVAGALIARFAVTRSLLVGLGMANASLGGATGYRERPPAPLGDYLFSDWESRGVWGGAFWRPAPGIRMGGGPGWYRMKDVDGGHSVGRVGLVLEAGAELPANRLLFLGLTLRGHLIPSTEVPYGDVVLHPSWSYLTLSAGLGIHLF